MAVYLEVRVCYLELGKFSALRFGHSIFHEPLQMGLEQCHWDAVIARAPHSDRPGDVLNRHRWFVPRELWVVVKPSRP